MANTFTYRYFFLKKISKIHNNFLKLNVLGNMLYFVSKGFLFYKTNFKRTRNMPNFTVTNLFLMFVWVFGFVDCGISVVEN